MPRPNDLCRPALLASLILILLESAFAQTVEFSAQGFATPRPGVRLQIEFADVPVEEGTAGLRVAGSRSGVEVGLRLRQASSLATIGNVVTNFAAEGSTAGDYSVALSARGVLGPVAARARLFASDGERPLAPVEAGALTPLPELGPGSILLGMDLGATYRVSRSLVIDASPSVYLRSGRVGGRLDGDFRLVRAFGSDDLSFSFESFLGPGGGASVAAGAGYSLNRRRDPSWRASLLLGYSTGTGILPGLRVEGGERTAAGDLDLEVAIEPYRLDASPYRGRVRYRFSAGPGELALSLRAALHPPDASRLELHAGYRLPFRQ